MAALVVGRARGGWGFGHERVGGGSPDDARWDARKKERAAEEGVRSPDLRKKEGWDFGQRRVGGGSPDDDRWDLRKRTRGSPDDARWDLQKKRREEEERNGGGSPEPELGKKNDEEEKKKVVVVVARGEEVEEEEVKRGKKWCAGMRVPWVEEGPHMLYAGPSFLAGAAPDPSSLPIPSFGPPRRRTSSSGGGVAVRVALIFLAGLVLRLRQLERVRPSCHADEMMGNVDIFPDAAAQGSIETFSFNDEPPSAERYWLSVGPGDFQLSSAGCANSALYSIVIESPSLPVPAGCKVITSSIPIRSPQFAVMKSVNYLPNALTKWKAKKMMDLPAYG
ncbi:hypothetical protein OsJ_06211 [Oryza sativa Japonica Group]|uniref:Uncharacterized protein n=1 Tax=Oryza sativa subsp. japonica TaxID=39947 RepID=B9F4Y1_ORYSJ|nr:hypothetical protein OsJ_06211 [Oryza sativa Japonica Group]